MLLACSVFGRHCIDTLNLKARGNLNFNWWPDHILLSTQNRLEIDVNLCGRLLHIYL